MRNSPAIDAPARARIPTEADAVIVGAGLGGLLAGLRLARAGRSVVILERADRAGGRFTATSLHGAEVSTGALHLVPNGSNGALGRLLRELEVPIPILDADVFASVWTGQRHLVCRRPPDLLRLLDWQERIKALRLLVRFADSRFTGSFHDWLLRDVGPKDRVYQLFRAFSEFALSLPLFAVPYRELRRALLITWRTGLPGVPRGGCRAVVEALAALIVRRSGRIFLDQQVEWIHVVDGQVRAVATRNRRDGSSTVIETELVISNLGPDDTLDLCRVRQRPPTISAVRAGGLKMQFLSPVSLIPHRSVMLCLGTERVAGVAQPSNADPALAPPGWHLVISHQILRSADLTAERAAGMRDLRRIFGPTLDGCRLLSCARFRDGWPVNRAAQGADVRHAPPVRGLHWVGDAYKPEGYMMVEGVAETVRRLPL